MMLDFQKILNEFLQQNNLTLRELNSIKYSKLKYELLREFIRRSATAKISQRKAHKKIRELGLKFTNEEARATYREVTLTKPKIDYPSRLRQDFKPSLDRIPIVTFKTPKNAFMYGAKIYLNCSKVSGTRKGKKTALKRVPKYAIKIGGIQKYNSISEWGFWSEQLLTRRQVEGIMSDYFIGMDMNVEYSKDIYSQGSNYGKINFNACEVVGFKYIKALRA